MKPFKYITVCMMSTLMFGALVVSFNWYVDPFGYFERIPFGAYHDYETRVLKTRIIKNDDYDAIILGSSRTAAINTDFVDRWGFKTFNGSFLLAYPEEILYYAENYLGGVKTVIIGFDYFMFNAKCKDFMRPDFGRATLKRFAKFGISYFAVKHSAQTLRRSLRGSTPRYTSSGSRIMDGLEAENAVAKMADYTKTLSIFDGGLECGYQISGERLRVAQKIFRILTESGRKVYLFIHPFHPVLYERISSVGQAGIFEDWRKRMKMAFPGILDLSTGPLAAPKNFYWNDPVHYTQATGRKIIDLLLSGSQKTLKISE